MVKNKVTVENFCQVETLHYIKKYFNKIGKTNTFFHYRDFNLDNAVIRMNLDTLYSIAILDSKDGEIILELPQINNRYFSCCILDEEHYQVFYTSKGGIYHIPIKDEYLVCLIRILVKSRTSKEIKKVNKLQDKIKIHADNYSSYIDMPVYDKDSYRYTRDLISKLYKTAPDMSSVGMFGKKGEVNELKHLFGTQMGWGGLNAKYAFYKSFIPTNNNGIQEYSLTFSCIPVRAFWSIIVYDKDGFILDKPHKSLNNFTAKKNSKGNYIINFSNKNDKINTLNIIKGWNYTIRMYEPSKKILDGKWQFPKLVTISLK